jgi:hypothetical protein
MGDLIRDCQEQTFSSYKLQYGPGEQAVPASTAASIIGDQSLPQHQLEQEEPADENLAAAPRNQVPEYLRTEFPNSLIQDTIPYESEPTSSVALNDPPGDRDTTIFSYPGNDPDRLMCGCSYFCTCLRNPTGHYPASSPTHVALIPSATQEIEPTKAHADEEMTEYSSKLPLQTNEDDFDWASYLDSG